MKERETTRWSAASTMVLWRMSSSLRPAPEPRPSCAVSGGSTGPRPRSASESYQQKQSGCRRVGQRKQLWPTVSSVPQLDMTGRYGFQRANLLQHTREAHRAAGGTGDGLRAAGLHWFAGDRLPRLKSSPAGGATAQNSTLHAGL